jgi:farnesyl diphosphate synthase
MTATTSPFDPARFEAALEDALTASASLSPRLLAAMRHALLAPGKRLRPQLVFAAGALIEAAVIGGALCGPKVKRTLLETLAPLAAQLGLAFQIVDDLLDATSDAATLGKTPGKDARQGKQTFVTLLGERAARERLRTLQRQIDAAIAALGRDAAPLATVAQQVIERDR